MKQVIQNKVVQVEELSKKIKDAKSFLVFEYLGLNAIQSSELRQKLFKGQAQMIVIKNNILNRALKVLNNPSIPESTGPCAIIISNGDEIIPFKEVYDLSKENDFIKYKFGVLDGSLVDKNKLATIATLPGKDGLLSMLCSVLLAPLRNFMYGLKAVGEGKK